VEVSLIDRNMRPFVFKLMTSLRNSAVLIERSNLPAFDMLIRPECPGATFHRWGCPGRMQVALRAGARKNSSNSKRNGYE
jgi:hypothetical protein